MKQDIEWEEFKLTRDNAKELKIDDFSESVESLVNKLREEILAAEKEAVKENIQANTIIINSKFCKSDKFYLGIGERVYEYPPMILGKAVVFEDILPDDVAFALAKTNVKNPAEELEKLRNLLKKYVKTDGFSLRFKNISFQKNKNDFEYLKELISDDNL